MANYFIAGVGHAMLFKGDELFADCRTLADSSITIGVTAEEIRGGEGNALWGKYFHDSTFDMKLTDIMFNMEYVAANVGAEIVKGGDIFMNEELKADENGVITLTQVAVPAKSGSDVYAWIVKADNSSDKRTRVEVADNKIADLEAGVAYCVRYCYTNPSADKLVVSSQFIPDTLYAILSVALYAGDDKNPENGTKVGEIVIKIPRFQLSGAMELSMTAAGTSQTSLEGSALASGAKGCEGKGIYAEIIQVIYNAHWYDDASGLIVEDNYREVAAGEINEKLNVYAWYASASPKLIPADELTFEVSDTGLSVVDGVVTGTPAGSGAITISVKAKEKETLDGSATFVIA